MNPNSLFSLTGKRALVTGGSRGIGYMIAEGLASAGVHVTICARKEKELADAAAKLAEHGACETIIADLGGDGGPDRLAAEIAERGEPLHILVNNAGIAWGAPIDAYPSDAFDKVMRVNVGAVFALTQKLLPLLRQAATPEDPARVINIASIDALSPPQWETYAYGASKAGVVMLTRHLAGRLAREHITVNAIAPGLFPSRMTSFVFAENESPADAYKIPLGRVGTAEDIAGAVTFLASRAGAFVTGATLPVCGGAGTTHLLEINEG